MAEANAGATAAATNSANNFAKTLPLIGAIIAGVILAAVGITAIVSAITSGKSQAGTLADQATQQLQDMQTELYNLRSAASNVNNLADEFEELSKKIGKSNEELQRMSEIAQEANDIAGYTIVDTSKSAEEQAAAMRAYAEVQEQKALGTLNSMEDTIQFSASFGMLDTGFVNSLTKEQQEEMYGNVESISDLLILSTDKDYLDAYVEYMRDYDESFAASVRAIAEEEIEGLENIDNTELRDAILNASVDQFENIFSTEKGFDFSKFNEVFNSEMLANLDNVYSSDSVGDYARFYHNLSKEQKAWLTESLPIFQMFESVSKDTAVAFGEMGFSMEDVNTIFANLADGGERAGEIFGKVVEEINNMEFKDINDEALNGEDELAAKRRETFKQLAEENKKFAEDANRVMMMSDAERQQAAMAGDKMAKDYQAALDKRNSLQRIVQYNQEAYEAKKAAGKAKGEDEDEYNKALQDLEKT